MRDYNKMKEEGWIPQVEIEQELSQERRAARRAFQLKKTQINAEAEAECERAKRKYLAELDRINKLRDDAIRQEEDFLNVQLTELAREENVLRKTCYEMGIYDNHAHNKPQG